MDLTDLGREQAESAAKELQFTRFDTVFTSGLKRAIETSRIILGSNNFQSEVKNIHNLFALNERDDGSISGMEYKEAMALFPRRKWLEWTRNYYASPPGGESLYDVSERVLPVLVDKIMPLVDSGQTILVVTHANVMKIMFGYLQEIEESEVPLIQIENGMPYIFKPR